MESDITVLRGLSKRINALLIFDELCVDQLHSISQTLTSQVVSGANVVTLLEIITRDVHKLLLLAKEHKHDSKDSRVKLVEVVRRCIEKLRVISTQVEVDSSMVFSHIKSCCEKDLKAKTLLLREIFPLMLSFGNTEVDAGVSEEALISLNHILIGVSRGERLALSISCKPELVHLANYLLHCGDYSLQEVIMETFTRMAPQTSRKSGCSVWFENFPPEAQEAFLGFGKIVFQVELKPFLNAINGKWKTGVRTLICEKVMFGDLEMYNPESQHLQHFYVDFSMGSKIITFFGVPNKGPLDSDTNPLIFVKILREDIKSSVLIATQKPNYHELTLSIMMIPVCFLANTKYHSETEIVMLLNVEDIEILKNVIGDKFNINTSEASSRLVENDSKQELVVIKSSNKRVTQEPGFYMFRNPEDNVSVVDSAPTDIIEPEYLSLSDDEANAKKCERLATPMNLEPVRVDRSPGKSTYADYLTVADSDENLGEPDIKGRKATPAAKSKNLMPTKATPAEILVTKTGTPAPLNAGIPPRKSSIEISSETASEECEAESLPGPASPKKRTLSTCTKEDLATQLTMVKDDVFIDEQAKGQTENSLPHEDFVEISKQKQLLATFERQRKVDFDKVSESSNDSTFKNPKPCQKAVKKKALPDVSCQIDKAKTSKLSVQQNDEINRRAVIARALKQDEAARAVWLRMQQDQT